MPTKTVMQGLIVTAALLAGSVHAPLFAQQPGDANVPSGPSNDADDNRVTTQIRTALAADESLSASDKAVGIATNPQAVILRGAVSSSEGKERIETVAGQFAGPRQIQSELTIRDY